MVDEKYRTVCVNISSKLCITEEVLTKFSRILEMVMIIWRSI